MEITIKKSIHSLPQTIQGFRFNQEFSQPDAYTDGVSFPAIPRHLHFAISTVIALGTISNLDERPDFRAFEHSAIVLPGKVDTQITRKERYANLRDAIVNAGIPMLSDEELREEIRTRRGLKPDLDS